MRARRVLLANALTLSVAVVAAVVGVGGSSTVVPEATGPIVLAAPEIVVPAPTPPPTTPAPKVAPKPTPTVTAAPRPAQPVPTATRKPVLAAERAATGRHDLTAYRGLGTWVDAYDWAPEIGGTLSPTVVDQMAAEGIRTLYIQAAKNDVRSPGDLLSPALLKQWVARAHAHGMQVQAWYLPKLEDPALDERHLRAILGFRVNGRGFDTVGLDIEARNVSNVAERNKRLIVLTRKLRASVPNMPLAGIVVAPVVTEALNRAYWSPFPWGSLKPLFDVWQPMGYFTDRKDKYRDARLSTLSNAAYLRGRLGNVPIHSIGGIGAPTAADLQGFVAATRANGSIGASLYDWATTPASAYPLLADVPR